MKRWLIIGILVVLLAGVVTLFAQRATTEKVKAANRALIEQMLELTEENERQAAELQKKDDMIMLLASLDAVHCEIQYVVNNKAILGQVKTGDYNQLAQATLHYLRGELIAEDTLVITKRINSE